VHLLQDEWGTSTTAPLIVNPYTPTLAQSWAEHPPPPPPTEDAHSEDRLARLFEIKMNRLFSINKKEMLVEDHDMLDAGSTITPSRTITMTVAPQVCLFVLRTHHVQAYAFLLTRAHLAG
jgi:hypothetical protein